MAVLERLDDDLWVAACPHKFWGLHLGARMTVLRLKSGGLFVHSPIGLSDVIRGAIDDLGPVRHIVAPNLFHHVFVGEYATAYPDATVHGVPGLARKRKDLAFDAELGLDPHPDWADEIDQLPVRGSLLGETVFFHRRSRSLVSADLTENFATSPHWPTRFYLKTGGIHGKPGLSGMMRLMFRDKKATRASIDEILKWPFERVVIAHGDVITERGPEIVRDTYAWL